ncbi:BamA/TamA family outer membrane protein [Massilia sp. W12]|uniref:autotransporter assembly complex protein TamA n=1 Tax=Massilia sp. W12 TaxID=3126507 RepID=UPI0030D5F8BA
MPAFSHFPAWRRLALAALTCCALQAQAQGPDFTVEFSGAGDLRSLLQDNLELLRWRGHPQLDNAQTMRLYRQASAQIQKLLQTEGYYAAKVTPGIQREQSPWQIRFEIETGPQFMVSQVNVLRSKPAGGPESEILEEANEFRQHWDLLPGSAFRHADWEAAKRALVRKAGMRRYPRILLKESEAQVDLESNSVKLTLILETGPEVVFGVIHAEGAQRYPESMVDQLNTSIVTRAEYNEQALLDLQQKLQDSNYYSSVVVLADFVQEMDFQERAVVPVLVRLNEYKRRKVDAGLGYSTNTGKRVQLTLEDLMFFGKQAKTALLLESRKQQWQGRLQWPTTREGYHDSISAASIHTKLDGERTHTSRIGVARTWGAQALQREFGLELLAERRETEGLAPQSTLSLPLSYQVTWRKLDSFLQPRKGYLLQAASTLSLLPLRGSVPFARANLRLQTYWPLSPRDLLLGRAEAGAVLSRNTEQVPASFLFRAGGDQSVRGYGWQELGVREGAALTGGRYQLTGSIEYQHWINKSWGGAAFIDGGNAGNQIHQLRPAMGYGVGARWNSPVGPVNLDWAYGRDVRKARLHFSLGLAF